MTTWKYKHLRIALVNGSSYLYHNKGEPIEPIGKMGEEGWELVSVAPLIEEGYTSSLEFFFKRPID